MHLRYAWQWFLEASRFGGTIRINLLRCRKRYKNLHHRYLSACGGDSRVAQDDKMDRCLVVGWHRDDFDGVVSRARSRDHEESCSRSAAAASHPWDTTLE